MLSMENTYRIVIYTLLHKMRYAVGVNAEWVRFIPVGA